MKKQGNTHCGGADALVAAGKPFTDKMRREVAPGSFSMLLIDCGNPARALRDSKPNGSHEESQKANMLYIAALIATRVEFTRGDFAAAEIAGEGQIGGAQRPA